jgi:hypothetical protein
MDPISSASAVTPTAAPEGTVQASAGISVMKKSENLQAAAVAELLQALPQPALATTGTLGTQVNTYA